MITRQRCALGLGWTLAVVGAGCGAPQEHDASPLQAYVGAATRQSAPADPTVPTDAEMTSDLRDYCAGCHSGTRPAAGVALDDVAHAAAAAKASVTMLDAGKMPPRRATQPDAATHDAMTAWFRSKT